ncbi:hypothetical protein [Fodinibius sp. Rm-B-1B1-1]|uniref:hypothetical protein n=1 Tax=Fodinibius alkaliphilus TaxID=3140241 RepID=UPI00315A9E8B
MNTKTKNNSQQVEEALKNTIIGLDNVLKIIAEDPSMEWLVNEIMYDMNHLDESIQKLKEKASFS